MASKFLQSDPITLRTCIFYEFAQKKPAWETFQNFCRVMGDDAIGYPEFEFWFYRFSSGNFDLSSNEYEESKKLELYDLPRHLMEKIVEGAELKEQLILRKVSRRLRALVDQVQPNFKDLQIRSDLDHICLRFYNTEITYAGPDYKKILPGNSIIRRCHVIDEDYLKMCLKDLKILLKNPKLKLGTLEIFPVLYSPEQIEISSKFYDDVGRLLKSSDVRCHVKSLKIMVPRQDEALSILPYFKPSVLTEICLFLCFDFRDPLQVTRIDKLTETEQWKRAEEVVIDEFTIQEPMESFYHLRHFEASWDRVTPEMLKGLRDALSKSTIFEYCMIYTDDQIENVEQIMGPKKVDNGTFIYSIPNSTDILETVLRGSRIEIEKKSKD